MSDLEYRTDGMKQKEHRQTNREKELRDRGLAINNVNSIRTEYLFCSLRYPKCLEQCLAQLVPNCKVKVQC